VVDIKGERLSYNTKESMLNPHFLVLGGDERNWLAYLSDPESP
jgi:3'(2'), 5'-bisphosphate nucleotidase